MRWAVRVASAIALAALVMLSVGGREEGGVGNKRGQAEGTSYLSKVGSMLLEKSQKLWKDDKSDNQFSKNGPKQDQDELRRGFEKAMVDGDGSTSFIKRLQDIWFVEDQIGSKKISQGAEGVAARLQVSGFPEDMRGAINANVDPCDDFYEFACGNYEAENQDIPKYKSSKSLSWDHADKTVRESETEMFKTDSGPAGLYFRSCMDEDRVNSQGAKPLEPWMKLIDSVKDKETLVSVVTELNKQDVDVLFSWYISTNPRDSSTKSFNIGPGSFSLPDKTYYTEDSAEMEGHRSKLVEVAAKFFKLIGREDAEKEAKMVLELETRIAKSSTDRAEERHDHGKPITVDVLEKQVPSWPWRSWLQKLSSCTSPPDGSPKACESDYPSLMDVGTEKGLVLLLRDEKYLDGLEQILQNTPLETIKAKLRWNFVKGSAVYLSADFIDVMVEYSKDLYGIQEKNPRPRKCYYSTSSDVAWPSAKLYVDKVFHVANRQAALEMLEGIRSRFLENLKKEEWMSPDDRLAAQTKLEKMFFQVAWPTDKEDKADWPVETTDLDGMLGPDFFTNFLVVNRKAVDRDFRKMKEAPKRRSWGGSTPTEVNAFYGPNNNGLWIPAGILQAPFFDASNPDARNYGSIGSVLGHEMTHGFDDSGREYDERGSLHDWWHKETVEKFKERSSCVARLFDSYSVSYRHVNGNLTLGEDMADAGGLKFAYQAFMAAKQRQPEEQRVFFTAFAQTWCTVERKKGVLNQVLTDPHAPNKFRVLGALSQFAPFAEAFQCPRGSPMAPLERCDVW
eukprot:747803-Hanusia_phi.AAC.3